MNKISTFKIAATYIGTVVGAGFATGQEILQFFARFGIGGVWGIALATVLFVLFGFVIMQIGYKLYAKSHLEIIRHSGGRLLSFIMDVIITFFLFGALTAMIAGTGALFAQQFGISPVFGNILMAVITIATVLTGIDGVINSISAVVPFLLVSVVVISLMSIFRTPPDMAANAVTTTINGGGLVRAWAPAAVLYVSYNIVGSVAVLGPLGSRAVSEKAILRGALLGGLGLGLGAIMIFFALHTNMAGISGLEVPMSHIAGNISRSVAILYTIILIAEVYTTAVGALFGFAARAGEKFRLKARTIIAATGVAALFASFLGFSNLVRILYPLVGYGGLILLGCLLFGKVKSLTKRE